MELPDRGIDRTGAVALSNRLQSGHGRRVLGHGLVIQSMGYHVDNHELEVISKFHTAGVARVRFVIGAHYDHISR